MSGRRMAQVRRARVQLGEDGSRGGERARAKGTKWRERMGGEDGDTGEG